MKKRNIFWISFLCPILAYSLVINALAYFHDSVPLDVLKSQANLSKEVIVKVSEDLKAEEEMLRWGLNVKAISMIQQAKAQRLPLKIDLRNKLTQQFPDYFSKEINFLSQDIEKDRFIMTLNRWLSMRRRVARNKIKLFFPKKIEMIEAMKEKLMSLEETIYLRENSLYTYGH
jgi:hypothetical protein